MTTKYPPLYGKSSFECPSCKALAHQNWFHVYGRALDESPFEIDPERVIKTAEENEYDETFAWMAPWGKKLLAGEPFGERQEQNYTSYRVELLDLSQCFSCKRFAVWRNYRLVSPIAVFAFEPNSDMDPGAANDFREAAAIFDQSPRGSAALLRLALQKTMIQLGLPGKDINKDIGTLVSRGLAVSVQQALDIVRVIGNNAVHPGQIDVDDNRDIAVKLFSLLNIIVDSMVSQPKQITEMFGSLPQAARDQIEKRDAPKAIAPPAVGSP